NLPPLAVSMAAAAGVSVPSAKAPTTMQSTVAEVETVWFRLNSRLIDHSSGGREGVRAAFRAAGVASLLTMRDRGNLRHVAQRTHNSKASRARCRSWTDTSAA